MRAVILASLLALAACGGEAAREAPAAPEPTASAPASPAATAPASMPAVPATIPARFHGVWDAETGSCDPASDLRLDIGPQRIGFYESQGSVTAVTESKDGSVVIALAMEGEGDKWDQTIRLELIRSDGAEWLLSLPGSDSDVVLRPMRLKRCPA